jgi:hypothetical protein
MARGLTKIGLVIGVGLLSGVLMAGTASAAPTDDRTATASDGSKVPAPTRDPVTPPGSKQEGGGQTAGKALPMHLDGTCSVYANGTGDLCLWYFSSFTGSRVDFYYNDSNLYNNVFLTSGSGKGAVVASNAESAYNYDSIWTAWVCTDPSYAGSCGYILPRTGGNFTATFYNRSDSLYWTL